MNIVKYHTKNSKFLYLVCDELLKAKESNTSRSKNIPSFRPQLMSVGDCSLSPNCGRIFREYQQKLASVHVLSANANITFY